MVRDVDRPTQADVARHAGVSQTTVSQVLSGRAGDSIPIATRQRVLAAALRLDYQPNRAAQSLRTSRSRTIGFVIPDITNPFYPALEQAVQDVVDAHEHDLLIVNTRGTADKEIKSLRLLQQGRVDGLIGVFFHVTARTLHAHFRSDVPIVRVETRRQEEGDWPLDNLYVDHRAAARAVVDHLLAGGHRDVAMIAGPAGMSRTRVAGYEDAMRAAGRTPRVVAADDFTAPAGADAMRRLLSEGPIPAAMFAANDMLAVGALGTLQLAGLRVPDDIAVAGFDDIPIAQLATPSLTTVRQFQNRLGTRAAELLFDRLEGRFVGPTRCEEHPFEVVVRDST